MVRPFRTAAVLGAGTMGAQIAAHLTNCGVKVRLFDVTREAATAGLGRLRTLAPNPCFVPDVPARIATGSFTEDAASLSSAEWIVEAVVESLDVKRSLLTDLAPHLSDRAVVSTNTSGIPIAAISSGLPAPLRPRFLGTHFFNPPRYLRLLEVIPTADTDPAVTARVTRFADHRLGKGVVRAKDAPGFIANRIGIFGALRTIDALARGEWTIEEIDAITGPVIGRPKSATFRTIDIAGLDVFAKVAADLAARLPDGGGYALPPLVQSMLERGLAGEKAAAGFYKRVKGDSGSTILALDPATLEYRDLRPARLPVLDAARGESSRARLLTLLDGSDRVSQFLWQTLGATLLYAWQAGPDIASSPADVDRAMRLGFGWEAGPFELIEAIGIDRLRERCGQAGAGAVASAAWPDAQPEREAAPLSVAAACSRGIVKGNAGASLVDLGDGVLCVEFHSKLNTIGGDAIAMIQEGVREAERNFQALVVANDADVFSAGANLMLILLEAQEGNWDDIDVMVRAFQAATMGLKTAAVPVVVAPAGLALGGGCELCLHGARVRAAAESYIGLVEVGVGLLPAGGGTKEMLVRAVDRAGSENPFPFTQAAFETIGFGKVSTSAEHARLLGYLQPGDGITMNRDRLIEDAKRDALALAGAPYQPANPRVAVPVGGAETLATLDLGLHLAHRAGRISDHEKLIGHRIARVLAGGDAPHRTTISEQALLDLEREAFLSLCGERKTLERMSHTLKTGKTLRN